MAQQYNDSVTLQGLKQDCYFIGKFNAGTFDQNDLKRIINKYYYQAQTAIRAVNEDFFSLATRTNLVASPTGNNQYSLPPDYEKINFIEVATFPLNLLVPLRTEYVRATIVTSDQITSPAGAFTSPTIIMYGDYFELVNIVASTVTGGIRIVYTPYLTELVNDTDVPNIFPDYRDVITWGSLIDIAPRLNNDQLLLRAMEMYKKRTEDLKNNISARIGDMAGDRVEGQTTEGGWSFPFGQGLIL